MTREATVTVDAAALAHNVSVLRAAVAPAAVMAVVKANAYGHGAVASALAFEEAGVDWLGVVDLAEAVALREGGVDASILCWQHAPGETFERAATSRITPAVSEPEQLRACAAAGVPAVHLVVDTGLSREGATEDEWPELFDLAAELKGTLRIEGLMSHVSNTSPQEDGHQMAAFIRAAGLLIERGITPPLQHLAASAAALSYGAARITMVRFGLAMYGLSPFGDRTSADLGLKPAMTLSAPVVGIKAVAAGEGTSYGLTWRADRDTRLALLPIGYADGIARHAGNASHVLLGGELRPVVGRVAMNALTVEIGDADVALGDEAVFWGDPEAGHPSAKSWADSVGTIDYEVVAHLSPRLPRSTA